MGVCGGSSSAFALLHPGSAAQEKLCQWSQGRNLYIGIFWGMPPDWSLSWAAEVPCVGKGIQRVPCNLVEQALWSHQSLCLIPLCCRDEEQSKTLGNSFPSPHSTGIFSFQGPCILGEQRAQAFQPLGRWQLSLLALCYLNISFLSQNTLKTFPVLKICIPGMCFSLGVWSSSQDPHMQGNAQK